MSTASEKKWARYVQDRDHVSYSEALRLVRAWNEAGRPTPEPGKTPPRRRPVAQVVLRDGVASIRGVSGMCPVGHIGGTAETCTACRVVAEAIR